MTTSDRHLLLLLRDVVAARAGGVCEISGEINCDAHHIFGRANKAVRYCPENCVWLSNSAHRWAEAHPEAFRALMVEKRGNEWWIDLVVRKNVTVKYDNYFREQWKKILQAELQKVAA